MQKVRLAMEVDCDTKKRLKMFAVQNDKSMGEAIQVLLDREEEYRRCH